MFTEKHKLVKKRVSHGFSLWALVEKKDHRVETHGHLDKEIVAGAAVCKAGDDPIYQPVRSGRIWHKVIFKRSLTGLNSEFSFS